jgi:hypothetical protein
MVNRDREGKLRISAGLQSCNQVLEVSKNRWEGTGTVCIYDTTVGIVRKKKDVSCYCYTVVYRAL